jgi:L-alanine-DL-glutamate epimerase-like enolase superfamily enzyme
VKVARLETFTVSVPYRHLEVSSRVRRGGVTDVLVKLTADDGRVGWGESCSGADAPSVEQAVLAARPFVVGRDPWELEAICRDYFRVGLWDFRPMTGSFAFAGIDQALWDLCGQEAGQPLYRLWGGALRPEVNYFYYLAQGSVAEIERQCADGVRRGYTTFYLKVGVQPEAEEDMLAAIRRVAGDAVRLRVDANEAWRVPEAIHWIRRWHARFRLDFVEAPVRCDPPEGMREVRQATGVAVSANEGLWRPEDVLRMVRRRGADVLCFSSYWVGSLTRFLTLSRIADWEGLGVVKHTHGELGIAAAAMHHAMLVLPNTLEGCQQTAQMMVDDVLAEPLPIAEGPRWGLPQGAGLGVRVDEEKVAEYHRRYRVDGPFLPYDPQQLPGGAA